MGSYEERLQDISFYGEGDWKVSSGGNCRMRCSRLSVLSEHSGTAVYDPGTSPVPENAKEKMYCQAEAELNYQFRDALTSMNVAFRQVILRKMQCRAAVKDLGRLHENRSDILDEFRYIESQIRLSVPVEELFIDLGKRSGVEDIENFAAVFYAAKRTGGDMTKVIQKVARMLGDKIEVKKEIEATLAAEKSEQMIMSIMPAGIICYLKLTSPGLWMYCMGIFLEFVQ